LVKDILKEHLQCNVYFATANVNAPDEGIDLYVCHEDDKIKAAVQVKRRISREIESISEVRNFIGAMLVEGHRKGIFVTTAKQFSKATYSIPQKVLATAAKLELDLIDGEKLLEIMKATSPPNAIALPMGLKLDTNWKSSNGNILKTEEILLRQ